MSTVSAIAVVDVAATASPLPVGVFSQTQGGQPIGGITDNVALNKMAGWYATAEVTLTADVDLVASYPGLKCYAVEDITATGKYIYYREWWMSDSDSTVHRHNGTNGAFSGVQPQIRTLIYNAGYATVIKCYFQKA